LIEQFATGLTIKWLLADDDDDDKN